jgi:hypothetical protein
LLIRFAGGGVGVLVGVGGTGVAVEVAVGDGVTARLDVTFT